jgi:molecular chaperone HtpG
MLSDEKFYDKATGFCLVEDTDKNFYTLEEYKKLTEGTQTDKDGQLIYLYSDDPVGQYTYIQEAKNKGYNVLVMKGQLDTPFMNQQEQKQEDKKAHYTRVDADTISNLIKKADSKKVEWSEAERRENNVLFLSQIPAVDKVEWNVDFQALDITDKAVTIAQNEWMRRMKEMSKMQPGMNFYGQMPDTYQLIVNTEHPVVKQVVAEAQNALKAQLEPIAAEIADKEAQFKPLEEEKYKAKAGEFPAEKETMLTSLKADIEMLKGKESDAVKVYAKDNRKLRQLIDLALLEGQMLKGEALAAFIKRSTDLLA